MTILSLTGNDLRMSAFPLLSTKLSLPPRRPTLVLRPRLQQKMDLSLLPGHRLTILSAPAGFGKTTLVVDWQSSLAERCINFGWLSLDESDNDLARFLRYFIAALQRIQPELGQSALAALDFPQLPSVESLMVPLINDLVECECSLVLVLDDYQAINDLGVHKAVGYLVDHQPPQFHLVITTRSDPLLPLARLRARGEVNEIRSADLRFTPEEVLEFIQRTAQMTLTPDQAAFLEQGTEGWIAGLQIAALALQTFNGRQTELSEVDSFLASFGGTHQYVFDYLAQEVLSRQDPVVLDFLYQTSILDRLNPGLCDAVTGRSDSEQILKELDHSNLFILPLDERRQWYRYHRLFADFLRVSLDATHQAELYQRASNWFEQNDLSEEAISSALAGKDWPNAGRLIRQSAGRLLKSGHITTLLNWFQTLPPAVLDSDFELCTILGWISLLHNKMGIAVQQAEQAEALLSADTPPGRRGRLMGLQAFLKYACTGRGIEALQLAHEAAGMIEPADSYFHMTILSLVGQLQRQFGQVSDSIHTLETVIDTGERQAKAGPNKVDSALAMLQGNLVITYHLHGEHRRGAALCREVVREFYTSSTGQIAPPALFIFIPWGMFYYDANQLDEACSHVLKGMELCQKMGINATAVGGADILADAQFAAGNTEAALTTIRDFQQDALRLQLPWVASIGATQEARFQLCLGNVAAAEAWAEQANLPTLDAPDLNRIDDLLLYARLLMIRQNFSEAYQLLNAMRIQAERRETIFNLVDIHLYLGLACRGLGQKEESLQQMQAALRIAAPEGILRPFLDIDCSELLRELNRPDGLDAFIDSILALLPPAAKPEAPALPHKPGSAPGLVEPLTPRELEVLERMAEGLSNADIARQLYLTVNTLKAHTNSIYGKLDVHSRIQAVNRARELGLLPAA
jgi:LuxR family transcriptional regulator, maltose regulon positive regulatory protein